MVKEIGGGRDSKDDEVGEEMVERPKKGKKERRRVGRDEKEKKREK